MSAANLNALLRTTDTATAARSAGDPASPASRNDTLVTYEDFTTIRSVPADSPIAVCPARRLCTLAPAVASAELQPLRANGCEHCQVSQ